MAAALLEEVARQQASCLEGILADGWLVCSRAGGACWLVLHTDCFAAVQRELEGSCTYIEQVVSGSSSAAWLGAVVCQQQAA